MENNNGKDGFLEISIRKLISKCLLIVCMAVVFALIFHNMWIEYLEIYHTVLELICVFITASAFVSIWHTYKRNSLNICILGFGLFLVAVFNAIHALHFLRINLTVTSYVDLSTNSCTLGRLTAAITFFLFTIQSKEHINKWIGLGVTLFIGFTASYIAKIQHDLMPILLTSNGITSLKVILQVFVIVMLGISLYRIKDNINCKNAIEYSYVFQSLLLAIPAEVSFTLYNSVNSMVWTVGHVLKIASYYFLYKGIFVNNIIFSYERLEAKHEELENAHKEIKSITETLNDILDALPVGVFMVNSENKTAYINKKFEAMFKCNKDEIEGLRIEEVYRRFPKIKKSNSDFEGVEIGAGGVTYKSIATYKITDGQFRKFSVESKEIRNGFLSLVRDAKEQQELKNLNLQTETILNAVTNGVLMIDKDKKVILCNKTMVEIYEADKKEIIGMNIDELNNLTEFEAKELLDAALNGTSENQMYEVSLVSLKGNKKELVLYVSSIRNLDGEIIGGIIVSTDVTETNKQKFKIQQQEKLALLGQLGAGIVHETRNYLTTIKGRCQLIGLVAESENIKNYSKKIDEDVTEVNRIISEFLFLSKPREVELKEVSMLDIFAAIKNIVESSSLVKGVDVNMKLSKDERYLLCDEVQIKQVILNICKNAVDAMAEVENPELTVETGYNDLQNEMYIQIKDNGIGMTEEQLKKIGTMFYTTKSTGTGLGLNVCFQIIKDHKGRIEVDSKPNEGTFFTIILPCIEDDEDEELDEAAISNL